MKSQTTAIKDGLGFVRRVDLLKALPFSPTTLDRLIKTGDFPAPVKQGRLSLFRVSDVEAWRATSKVAEVAND